MIKKRFKSNSKSLRIAVAGNPNSGKSTIINAITGSRLQVGNWPGVTVEKKVAYLDLEDTSVELVDLPGVYSLSPYSQEEIIARDYLIHEKPDIIINVVDATNFERNLYLTIQLLELGIPLIIALNIYDEAVEKGYEFNIPLFEQLLGVKVIPTVAPKNEGIKDLLSACLVISSDKDACFPKMQRYTDDIEQAARTVLAVLEKDCPAALERYPARWLIFKIIEQDVDLCGELPSVKGLSETENAFMHFKRAHDGSLPDIMADARYSLAAGLSREVMKKSVLHQRDITDIIDKIVLNRVLGIPLFLGVMWLAFKITFDLATPFVYLLETFISNTVTNWAEFVLSTAGVSDWLISLVSEGIIGGVGFVLAFVPVIVAMMGMITFLEGSGYMARAAFIMDRAMHAIGLHGKAFIPMLLGFGCNVPSIYATRTLETTRDKILTALLIPLMSCGARLPVYVLFASAFFPQHKGTVLWSLYMLGILLAVGVGVIFKKTLFAGESPVFIMELPPYRIPSLSNLAVHTWEKAKHFLVKAGTYILGVSIIVWFLLHLPWGVVDQKDSYLGRAGQLVAPIVSPLGFGDWQTGTALITGVFAKETIVGTLGEIYSERNAQPTDPLPERGQTVLRRKVQQSFTPLSAYAFMVFVLLYMPCMVVGLAMKDEFGTWKWYGVALLYQTVLSWSVAFIIYQGGRLLGFGG